MARAPRKPAAPVVPPPAEPTKIAIVYRDPASLNAYAANSRTHTPKQIENIRASIREFGFTNPILLMADDVTIGAGHARQAAIERHMLMGVCFCTGVRPGHTLCPCMERQEGIAHAEAFAARVAAGKRQPSDNRTASGLSALLERVRRDRLRDRRDAEWPDLIC